LLVTPTWGTWYLLVMITNTAIAAYFPNLAADEFCKSGEDRITKIIVFGRERITVVM
jgi:hypothetical protein